MAAKVDIMNIALTHLGKNPIVDPDQNTAFAIKIKSVYDVVRQDLLRIHTWNFAETRVILGVNSTAPSFGWSYAFDLPTGCLRINQVKLSPTDLESTDYVKEGNQILCNSNVVYLYYNQDITQEILMDPMFVSLFGLKLAIRTCEAITSNESLLRNLNAMWKEEKPSTMLIDSVEKGPQELNVNYLLTARRGYHRNSRREGS
jgi:hypothetical protein